jgi:hypothetical protein
MSRVPQPVVYAEGEMTLANALDVPTEQLRMIKRCPDCEGLIVPCDNGIWLDAARAPADGLALMGMMEIGGMILAAGPAEGESGSRHTIHEHQPDEEPDA